jgi:hypothetical protein
MLASRMPLGLWSLNTIYYCVTWLLGFSSFPRCQVGGGPPGGTNGGIQPVGQHSFLLMSTVEASVVSAPLPPPATSSIRAPGWVHSDHVRQESGLIAIEKSWKHGYLLDWKITSTSTNIALKLRGIQAVWWAEPSLHPQCCSNEWSLQRFILNVGMKNLL